MNLPVAAPQLLDRADRRKNQTVLRTNAGAFAVNRLRARDDYFLDRQFLFADHLEHLRCAQRINVNVFRDLRHVAAVGRLVKDDVDLVERGRDGFAIAQVALNEFRLLVNPRRFAATVRLRLQIVEHANFPAFSHQQIGNVRSDQAGSAGDKCAFSVFRHDRRIVMDAVL